MMKSLSFFVPVLPATGKFIELLLITVVGSCIPSLNVVGNAVGEVLKDAGTLLKRF